MIAVKVNEAWNETNIHIYHYQSSHMLTTSDGLIKLFHKHYEEKAQFSFNHFFSFHHVACW